MNPFKTALAASSALIASTSLSFANVLVQTANFSASTNWGTSTSTTGFTPTDQLQVAGFNSSDGTLTGITVTVNETVAGSVNLTNNGTGSTNVSADLLNTLKFSLPGFGDPRTLIAATGSYQDATLAAGGSTGPQSVSGKATGTYFVSSGLTSFENAWDITLGDLGQVAVSAGNSNGTAVYTDIGALTFTVDYTYTPTQTTPTNTPEPATLAVLGSGLAGLGLLRRRKKTA